MNTNPNQHLCQARRCGRGIPLRMLMCIRHWNMVPRDLQRQVWKHYKSGQELDHSKITSDYLNVVRQAVIAVASEEGLINHPEVAK